MCCRLTLRSFSSLLHSILLPLWSPCPSTGPFHSFCSLTHCSSFSIRGCAGRSLSHLYTHSHSHSQSQSTTALINNNRQCLSRVSSFQRCWRLGPSQLMVVARVKALGVVVVAAAVDLGALLPLVQQAVNQSLLPQLEATASSSCRSFRCQIQTAR